MSRQQNPGSVLTFIIGVSIGALAALLLAPKAGKDLRSDLADGINDGMDQLRSTGKELKKRAGKFADAAQDRASKFADAAQERAGKFADEAQENVQDAIEAGQKAYRQAKA
jgi:gas vesicle protein